VGRVVKFDVPAKALPWLTRMIRGASSKPSSPLEIKFSVRHANGKDLSEEEEVEVAALLAVFATKEGIDEPKEKGGILPGRHGGNDG
jgi:hypothetical protein